MLLMIDLLTTRESKLLNLPEANVLNVVSYLRSPLHITWIFLYDDLINKVIKITRNQPVIILN